MINWGRVACGICVTGLQFGEGFVADERWALTEEPYARLLVPLPLSDEGHYEPSGEHASLAQTLFFADCIGFDHDCPTVVLPCRTDTPPPYEAIGHKRPWHEPVRYYRDALEASVEFAHQIRFNDDLALRYAPEGDPLASFEERFNNRREALSLYASAIRQVDLLSEYLGLYRVLEWPQKDNGKKFIEAHLDEIGGYDFGSLQMADLGYHRGPVEDPIEVFEVLRERAQGRIEALRTADIEIPAHLYALRNGLAHGKQDLVLNDFGPGVDAVAAELPLVKLLARIAVEGGGETAAVITAEWR
ncbi:methylamine utilization protein MauJ [Streptomyces sp. NPDC096095]|uniref:methylamine utilization protein MauJ n=1 Tax=Streptomyces sp. NPDC096095 TaxID=3155545 RepID=UPI00331A9187